MFKSKIFPTNCVVKLECLPFFDDPPADVGLKKYHSIVCPPESYLSPIANFNLSLPKTSSQRFLVEVHTATPCGVVIG